MDRYAIFVDAGYVYAAGGSLALDTNNRNQVDLDHERFIAVLRSAVGADFPNSGEFLRIYWYDAAPRGVPQPEHEQIAAQSGVKVRLGRLTRQGQKGVDSLVLRDMMKLSAEHAICTAFLVAGDEDLRQGVIEAQDYGVKVVLVGIEPTFGGNQARSLVEEADELRILSYSEVSECFEARRADAASITFDDTFDAYAVGSQLGEEVRAQQETIVVGDNGWIPPELDSELIRRLLEVGDLPPAVQLPPGILALARDGVRAGLTSQRTGGTGFAEEPAAIPVDAAAPPTSVNSSTELPMLEAPPGLAGDQAWAFREGADFGQAWLNEQPEEEVRYVRAGFPALPHDIDSDLLRRLVREMGLPQGSRIEDPERKAGRAGFWRALGMELDFGGPSVRRMPWHPIDEQDPSAFGRAFARQWAERAGAEEVRHAQGLVDRRIGLPSTADAALLRLASDRFGDPVPVEVRHRLREGFGEEILRL